MNGSDFRVLVIACVGPLSRTSDREPSRQCVRFQSKFATCLCHLQWSVLVGVLWIVYVCGSRRRDRGSLHRHHVANAEPGEQLCSSLACSHSIQAACIGSLAHVAHTLSARGMFCSQAQRRAFGTAVRPLPAAKPLQVRYA